MRKLAKLWKELNTGIFVVTSSSVSTIKGYALLVDYRTRF
jgi:hypothetical protein